MIPGGLHLHDLLSLQREPPTPVILWEMCSKNLKSDWKHMCFQIISFERLFYVSYTRSWPSLTSLWPVVLQCPSTPRTARFHNFPRQASSLVACVYHGLEQEGPQVTCSALYSGPSCTERFLQLSMMACVYTMDWNMSQLVAIDQEGPQVTRL